MVIVKRFLFMVILITALIFPTYAFASNAPSFDDSKKGPISQFVSSFLGQWSDTSQVTYLGASGNNYIGNNNSNSNNNHTNKSWKWKWDWNWDWDDDDWDDNWDDDDDHFPPKDSFNIWKDWFCY
ncbi:hypothetical protein D3C73_619030 [compost metagenome]